MKKIKIEDDDFEENKERKKIRDKEGKFYGWFKTKGELYWRTDETKDNYAGDLEIRKDFFGGYSVYDHDRYISGPWQTIKRAIVEVERFIEMDGIIKNGDGLKEITRICNEIEDKGMKQDKREMRYTLLCMLFELDEINRVIEMLKEMEATGNAPATIEND